MSTEIIYILVSLITDNIASETGAKLVAHLFIQCQIFIKNIGSYLYIYLLYFC
jgi:hypothetical protein